MKHSYTQEQLQQAISQSISIRQVLIILGISAKGGNYKVIHKLVKKWNLDISHFTGQGHSKGKTIGPKRDIIDYLNNLIPINSFRLKNRLLKEGILTPSCHTCNLSVWLNQPIPLELDHIDGNSDNNNLSNLRLLCPNCHAFTPTYRRSKQSQI